MTPSGNLEVKSGKQVTFSVNDVAMEVDMDKNYGTFTRIPRITLSI